MRKTPRTEPGYVPLAEEAQTIIRSGDLKTAISMLRKAMARAKAAGDLAAYGSLLANLGLAFKRQGKAFQGRKMLERAVEVLDRAGTQKELAEALDNLGFVERELGDMDTAESRHRAALQRFQELGDAHGMARALTNLGLIHKDQGRLTEASASFERALSLLADQPYPRDRAHALLGQALTLEHLHQPEAAQQKFDLALTDYRQTDDRKNEALTGLMKNRPSSLFLMIPFVFR